MPSFILRLRNDQRIEITLGVELFRVDIHRDNQIMQHCLDGYGFSYCGIIYLSDGAPRLAYLKRVQAQKKAAV